MKQTPTSPSAAFLKRRRVTMESLSQILTDAGVSHALKDGKYIKLVGPDFDCGIRLADAGTGVRVLVLIGVIRVGKVAPGFFDMLNSFNTMVPLQFYYDHGLLCLRHMEGYHNGIDSEWFVTTVREFCTYLKGVKGEIFGSPTPKTSLLN